MRILSWLLIGLAAVVAGAGAVFYSWVQDTACGHVTGAMGGGHCRLRMPWELGREDLVYTVLVPFGLAGLLLALGLAARARARRG
ncbi:MAG: hypothetical protein KF887_19450 [Paracoccaceae bacterium]|nr:MAG: hypothetical protein KF887_19450 [Paracoccaceae bacterium]